MAQITEAITIVVAAAAEWVDFLAQYSLLGLIVVVNNDGRSNIRHQMDVIQSNIV